jgi:DNA polymerase sigma|tara:strand:- start:726 stop:830 length:105 start_codon:yes stop_codon:yes gene_type:complete
MGESLMTQLAEKIKNAEERIKELQILIKHWKQKQ